MYTATSSTGPIIIVTGANGGVGFGICHRLILQLSRRHPPDSKPLAEQTTHDAIFPNNHTAFEEGLTLIMACRSTKRAEAARTELLRRLDCHIEREHRKKTYDGYAHLFRSNLRIDVVQVDLGVLESVTQFTDFVMKTYPYISHLVCNAGVANWVEVNYLELVQSLLRDPLDAISRPSYLRQAVGELSIDGLGWIWQCNIFSHYFMMRKIEPLLRSSPSPLRARVIWTSSLEATGKFFDVDDWQAVKSANPYEHSKYETDLLAVALDRHGSKNPTQHPIRHFVTDPGIVGTNLAVSLIGVFLTYVKLALFYVARLLGSSVHTMWLWQAAAAPVRLCLVSLSDVPSPSFGQSNGAATPQIPIRFGSRTDRFGRDFINMDEIPKWNEHSADADIILARCEKLYDTIVNGSNACGLQKHI